MTVSKDISVIIPVCDEEASLDKLLQSLKHALSGLGLFYEVIFVDDGSVDNSYSILERFNKQNEEVRVLGLMRNYGKSAALTAGFDNARGKTIVTLDADLQDDPNEIPNLLRKINEGYDVVCGFRQKRKDNYFKKITSSIFNKTISILIGVRVKDINTGLKAYQKRVVEQIEIYGGLYRFLPVLAQRAGFKVTEIPVKHFSRQFGRSKYSWTKVFDGLIDLLTVFLLTKYAERPAHFFGGAGFLSFLSGFLISLYLSVKWLVGFRPIGNRPLFFFGILLLVIGIQLISLGLLGEILVKGQKKRTYQIKEILD